MTSPGWSPPGCAAWSIGRRGAFLARNVISTGLRSLWVVVVGLLVWSVVMWAAERYGSQQRGEGRIGLVDAIVIGVVQCVALVPGVSRSGATISAGLFRGLDRVTATRMSFFPGDPGADRRGRI